MTCCTEGGEIWHEGPLLRGKFHPHQCNDQGIGPPKLFDQNVEYKRPMSDFHKICRIYTPFQDALAAKVSVDLLRGYGLELWRF